MSLIDNLISSKQIRLHHQYALAVISIPLLPRSHQGMFANAPYVPSEQASAWLSYDEDLESWKLMAKSPTHPMIHGASTAQSSPCTLRIGSAGLINHIPEASDGTACGCVVRSQNP